MSSDWGDARWCFFMIKMMMMKAKHVNNNATIISHNLDNRYLEVIYLVISRVHIIGQFRFW